MSGSIKGYKGSLGVDTSDICGRRGSTSENPKGPKLKQAPILLKLALKIKNKLK